MREETLIAVEWDYGIERGFKSREEAERFISRICNRTAPGFRYSVYSLIKTGSQHQKKL